MPNEHRIVSWNINNDRRVEQKDHPQFRFTANAFEDFSIERRFPQIKKSLSYLIEQKKVSMIALQELDINTVPFVKEFLEAAGYKVIVNGYNPDIQAFNFVFAFLSGKYNVTQKPEQIYLTRSGNPLTKEERTKFSRDEIFEHNLDTEFEKSVQVIPLKDKDSDEYFTVVNTHLGLTNKHRKLAAELLCSKLEGRAEPLLLVGDFNQFDSSVPEATLLMEQVEIFTTHGFTWNSESLLYTNPSSTFLTSPYDINRFLTKDDFAELDSLKGKDDYVGIREFYIRKIKEKNLELVSTTLDGVFSKRMQPATAEYKGTRSKALLFSEEGHRINPIPTKSELNEKLIGLYQEGKTPPSDHLPVVTKFKPT